MTYPNKSETVVSKQHIKARPVAMAEIQKSLERDVPNLSRRTSPRIADPALDSSKMAFMICTSCCTLSGDASWKITAFTAKREAKFAATVICASCWGSKVVPHQVSNTWFKHQTQYINLLLSYFISGCFFLHPKCQVILKTVLLPNHPKKGALLGRGRDRHQHTSTYLLCGVETIRHAWNKITSKPWNSEELWQNHIRHPPRGHLVPQPRPTLNKCPLRRAKEIGHRSRVETSLDRRQHWKSLSPHSPKDLLKKKGNYFTSTDPHHDISKQPCWHHPCCASVGWGLLDFMSTSSPSPPPPLPPPCSCSSSASLSPPLLRPSAPGLCQFFDGTLHCQAHAP